MGTVKPNKYGLWDKGANPCNIGGEALIEGVMMRGPSNIAIAVRKSDGSITVDKKPLNTLSSKYKILKIPFIRGAVTMVESLILGMRALMYSAEFAEMGEEEGSGAEGAVRAEVKPSKTEAFLEKITGGKLKEAAIYMSVAIALVLGVGIFFLLPNLIAGFAGFNKETSGGILMYNVFEGALRILIFVGYIALVSRMKDIRRVFEYHGAEHKTIHCFEHNEELTVDNVRKYTTRHPRCGTAFLFIVIIISMIVFSFIGVHNLLINIAARLVLIPLVMGISYEIIKLAGRSRNPVMRAVSLPGIALQKFTTREPDDSQIEVAIAALQGVVK